MTIEYIIRAAGGGMRIAEYLGLTRQAVYQWKRVPIQHVVIVERLSGIPRSRLRPDVYPPERSNG